MKPFIIVTVSDGDNKLPYDIEVPTNVPSSKLIKDVIETLSAYGGDTVSLKYARELYSVRLGRSLNSSETFAEAGIWNGDVIFIR